MARTLYVSAAATATTVFHNAKDGSCRKKTTGRRVRIHRRVRVYLTGHPEIRVIHLRRDNLLKQHVSKLLLGAKRERAWQSHTTEPVPIVLVRVSAKRAIEDMRRVRDTFLEFERLLSGHRKIELQRLDAVL